MKEQMKERWLKKCNKDGNSHDLTAIAPLPRSLCIEVTSACNHKCMFCFFHSAYLPKNPSPRFIDERLLEKLIREAAATGIGHEEIGFHMRGEPLLFQNLEKYIALSKELGFPYIYLTSNGVLATPERIRSLVAAGLDSIRFSINASNREDYLTVHGKDDFDIVMENLKALHAYKTEHNLSINTSVSTVVTKKNIAEKEQMKKDIGQYVDEIMFSSVAMLEKNMPELHEEYSIPHEEIPYEYTPCSHVFGTMWITCEGYVVPCCISNIEKGMIIDDYNNGTKLVDIWNSEKMQQIRTQFLTGDLPYSVCENCSTINKLFTPVQ